MREAMYAWFNKWLKGIDDPQQAKEPVIQTEPPHVLSAMDKPPPDNRGEAGIIEYFREKRTFPMPRLSSREEWLAYQHSLRNSLLELLSDTNTKSPLQSFM